DLTTGKPLPRIDRPPGLGTYPRGLAFSPDGKHLALGIGAAVELWEADGGKPVRPADGHRDEILAVGSSADGKVFITGAADGRVRLGGAATGRPRAVHADKARDGLPWAGWTAAPVLVPDRGLVAVDPEGGLSTWDLKSGERLRQVLRPLEEAGRQREEFVVGAPGGALLATAG